MSERKLIVIFTVLTLLISWAYEAFIIARGGVQSFGLVALLILMWIPGLVSILMRLVLKLGFADVRFIVGKPRYYFYAVSIPLVLAIVTGLLAAAFDIRQLTPIQFDHLSPAAPIFAMMLCFGLAGALGEELGWRGFLLPKMIAGGISHPYLISGIIWACWHLPLIAFGGFYTTTTLSRSSWPTVSALSLSTLLSANSGCAPVQYGSPLFCMRHTTSFFSWPFRTYLFRNQVRAPICGKSSARTVDS